MALLPINLQDVSAEGPPQLEIGCYDVEATKVAVNPAQDGKDAQVVVDFMKANRDPSDTASCRKYFALSEKALPFLKRFLLASGREDLANANQLDTDELLGLVCKVVISENTYTKDGETRTNAQISRFVEVKA